VMAISVQLWVQAPPAVTVAPSLRSPTYLRTRVAPLHTAERNALVRKIMTDMKLSMIEASKYVKANGLWKGAAPKAVAAQ
jgi:hypothetical protein